MNKAWHMKNKLDDKATMDQRLHWHIEHAKHCGCRTIPRTVIEEMKKNGIALPNLQLK